MNDRIKQFMAYKGLSSSELADSIGVQRSNVTHVLHGRNKPSFQFIAKLLETYPEINAKWLIMGQGEMLESNSGANQPNLFNDSKQQKTKGFDEEVVKTTQKEEAVSYISPPQQEQIEGKEIERIVVFYVDQTFKEYSPSK